MYSCLLQVRYELRVKEPLSIVHLARAFIFFSLNLPFFQSRQLLRHFRRRSRIFPLLQIAKCYRETAGDTPPK